MTPDLSIRLSAFEWLSKQSSIYNDVIPREILQQGFIFNNQRISLISPQGIFKPKVMQFPLSITTSQEFLHRMDIWIKEKKPMQLPASVIDAINFLQHEKVRRWESKLWFWADDPTYDKIVLKVADGKRDRDKQLSLYVELGDNGQVATTPEKVTDILSNEEYERGRRFENCISDLLNDSTHISWEVEQIVEYFNVLFSERSLFIRSEEK